MARLSRPGWLWLNTKTVYPRTVTHPSPPFSFPSPFPKSSCEVWDNFLVHIKWKIWHLVRIILVTFMKNYTDFPPVSGKTIPLNFFSAEFAPTFMQRRRQWLCPTCLCKFRHSPSIKAAPNRHRTYRHADSAAVCDIGSPQAHLTPHGIDALLPFTARLTPGYSFNAFN